MSSSLVGGSGYLSDFLIRTVGGVEGQPDAETTQSLVFRPQGARLSAHARSKSVARWQVGHRLPETPLRRACAVAGAERLRARLRSAKLRHTTSAPRVCALQVAAGVQRRPAPAYPEAVFLKRAYVVDEKYVRCVPRALDVELGSTRHVAVRFAFRTSPAAAPNLALRIGRSLEELFGVGGIWCIFDQLWAGFGQMWCQNAQAFIGPVTCALGSTHFMFGSAHLMFGSTRLMFGSTDFARHSTRLGLWSNAIGFGSIGSGWASNRCGPCFATCFLYLAKLGSGDQI